MRTGSRGTFCRAKQKKEQGSVQEQVNKQEQTMPTFIVNAAPCIDTLDPAVRRCHARRPNATRDTLASFVGSPQDRRDGGLQIDAYEIRQEADESHASATKRIIRARRCCLVTTREGGLTERPRHCFRFFDTFAFFPGRYSPDVRSRWVVSMPQASRLIRHKLDVLGKPKHTLKPRSTRDFKYLGFQIAVVAYAHPRGWERQAAHY